jgi:amino acid transporter
MFPALRRWLIGQPLATSQSSVERLSKSIALAVLSSDALSSVAYATEEILLVLAVAAATTATAYSYLLPISLVIAALLWIVAISYRQTIHAYPSGGGAYIVSKDNLGASAALTAGAALLVDYTLTVSVSVASGVAAITSAVQGTSLAWLANYPVTICLSAIAVITLLNLRGIRESGAVFAVPVYLFIFSFLGMIVWGLARYLLGTIPPPEVSADPVKLAEGYGPQDVSLLLLLGAFSGGCTAMTGVEAISNGVPAFRPPEARNASITLLWMAGLLTVMFLGTSTLAYLYHIEPRESETVISQFARIIFPGPMVWAYYLVQTATALILILAANTSFADFPRLASLMAHDGYLPRQFTARGDRLVYSNGIVALSLLACLLVWIFKGDVSRLIPLYAIGVFLSFTLSQAGMVRHWWRMSGPKAPGAFARWRSMAINALGATATACVLAVFVVTKFEHGAWIVVVVLPTLALLFAAMGRHYASVNRQLARGICGPIRECPPVVVVIPVQRIHHGLRLALAYSKRLSKDRRAVYVEIEPTDTETVRQGWAMLQTDVPLEVVPSPYREFQSVLLAYIDALKAEHAGSLVSVILAEFVPPQWWQEALHNGPMLQIKATLLYKPGVVVTSVPYVLKEE